MAGNMKDKATMIAQGVVLNPKTTTLDIQITWYECVHVFLRVVGPGMTLKVLRGAPGAPSQGTRPLSRFVEVPAIP